MDGKKLKNLFASVKDGSISVEDAVRSLKHRPYEDISCAKVDHHRHLRQGVPEVIFASGKTDEQVSIIARAMHKKSGSFLITKASKKIFNALRLKGAVFYPVSGIIAVGEDKKKTGNVLVLTCTGPLSRNYSVGVKLGHGMKLTEILSSTRSVAEGVATALSAYELSLKQGIEMPIIEQIYNVIYNEKPAADAVSNLMNRTLRSEF